MCKWQTNFIKFVVKSFLKHLVAPRVVHRFCKRSLNDRFLFRFQKRSFGFWKKAIVFKNDPLVLNF